MCIRFSINTKVKAIPFFTALTLAVISSLISIENTLVVFEVDISLYKPFIYSMLYFFIGVFLTMTFSFITPRIDKKLQLLNKCYFFPLLRPLHDYDPKWPASMGEAKEIRQGLMKHGKYFGINCYPRKLIKDINKLLEYVEEYSNLIQKLQEISKQKIGKDNLTILLGILDTGNTSLDGYNQDTVKTYEIVGNCIKQEKPELLEEIKVSNKKIVEKRCDVIDKFEKFLKDNSLGEDLAQIAKRDVLS